MKTIPLSIIILTLAALVLRVWQLDTIPHGLNRDEAALGYNAYLLLTTGTDEWGQPWPITLRSFGDYKLIGSVWAMMPFIAVLGFSDWAVRLPIALAGTALVPLVYVLSRRFGLSAIGALLPAILVAFSPVFIFFSRFGFEAILGLALLVGALVVWLQPLSKTNTRKRMLLDVLGILLFFLASITYNTPLLLLPVCVLFICAHRGIGNWRSWSGLVTGLILSSGVLFFLLSSATISKQAVTIFSDPTLLAEYPAYRQSFGGVSQTLLGNSTSYFGWLTLQRFVAFFSPVFLATDGGSHPWHQLPGFGHLVMPAFVLVITSLVAAIVVIAKETKTVLSQKIIFQKNMLQHPVGRLSVLLLALIYALLLPSITVDAPHATRSLFVFIVLFLIAGSVFDVLKPWLQRKQTLTIVLGCGLIIWFIFGTLQYVTTYFGTYARTSAQITQSGLSAVVEEARMEESLTPVVIDPGGYQYIMVAWDTKLPADQFFATIQRDHPIALGFTPGRRVGSYYFLRNPKENTADTSFFSWKDSGWQKNQ